ncbi:MAG: hypothetical protein AMXMBFR58_09680 [Phycisphaerae bacterium]|nr:hypothetical protein [Phycisphaerales bacterium]MCK6476960.1 hypothetical protein [Phycisphaerales bacterium]
MKSRCAILAALTAGAVPCVATGQVWDNVADFSHDLNPSGAWTLGKAASRPVTGVDLAPFSWCSELGADGLWFWVPVHGTTPWIAQNVTDLPIGFGGDQVAPPRTQLCRPGSAGQNAVLRWTSPDAATVAVEARFGGVVVDPDPTTTDVAVLHNGVELFAAVVEGVGAGATAVLEVQVDKGDVIDFAVGYGTNGSNANDAMALHVVITAPCPADFDQSGFVDTDDFTAFVTAFEAGTDDADFDGTGFVDTDDFTAFVLAFEAGC